MIRKEKGQERSKDRSKEKNKEKERKKRGNRKYGQAKLKHSKKGIYSCIISGVVFVFLSLMLVFAYISRGGLAAYIGAIGISTFLLAVAGCVSGIRGFKEREKDYRTCKIGIGFNVFFIIGFIAIFCRGLL